MRTVTYCARCNKGFFSKPSAKRKYCSKECCFQIMLIEMKCECCGKAYFLTPGNYKRRRGRFCSFECFIQNCENTTIQKPCLRCGEMFIVKTKSKNDLIRFCSLVCFGEFKTKPVEQRLENQVKKSGPDDCWEWTSRRDKDGYGRIKYEGRGRPAHVVALILSGVEVPDGMQVLHSCDNPPCCNPAHLRVGTAKDNSHDMQIRNRKKFNVGSRCSHSILTEEIVRSAKIRKANGERPTVLAREYGISLSGLQRAIRGITWKHVV